jgi:SAM-dependent methyltransferase
LRATAVMQTWEDAVRALLADPSQRQVVLDCYYDQPISAAALRYCASEEWAAVMLMIPEGVRTAVDIGAGQGVSSAALARAGIQVTAIEPDTSALVGRRAIDELAAALQLPIRAVDGTAEAIPAADGAFDFALARQVLHHARDLDQACREVFRVLRPGGTFLAIRDHVVTHHADRPRFFAAHPLHRYYGGENAFREDEYLDALRAAGFDLVRVLRSFDSVVNFAPHSRTSLRGALVDRVRHVPLAAPVLRTLLRSDAAYDVLLEIMSRFDRRPGRLMSVLCRKPGLA